MSRTCAFYFADCGTFFQVGGGGGGGVHVHVSDSEDHPNCLRISLDRTVYGKPVITRAARFCSLWSLFHNVSLMPSQTRQQ